MLSLSLSLSEDVLFKPKHIKKVNFKVVQHEHYLLKKDQLILGFASPCCIIILSTELAL